MAETLSPSGIVIPEQEEAISAAGVAEMRTVGATANSAYAALGAEIAGVESALDGKADKGNLNGPMPILEDRDLDTVRETGMWRAAPWRGIVNSPPDAGNRWARFRSWYLVGSGIIHEWDALRGQVWRRTWDGTAWSEWRVHIGGGGSGAGVGGEARTPVEVMGEWSTFADEAAYLDALAQHQAVAVFEAGRSEEDRPIRVIRLGEPIDPWGNPKPTILLQCTQHGDELGPREGAFIFARELAQATTFALFDVCVLIVPTVNPDRLDVSRTNANGVNINRDWEVSQRTQAETQAIASLFSEYPIVAAVDAHSFGYARQVSIRETRNPATAEAVRERSKRLYDGVFAMLEDEGHEVRMYGEPDAELTPGTFNNEVSAVDGIPTMLLEIPFHRNNYGRYSPNPHWQAHMAVLVFREVVQIVWRERDAFKAAKESA